MGRIVNKNQPCEKCGSSDAKQVYEDNSAFCFSCRSNYPAPREGRTMKQEDFEAVEDDSWLSVTEIASEYPTRGFKERNIYKQVAEHYGVKVSYDLDGVIDTHYYPYCIKDAIVGYKIRKLPKEFTSVGKVRGGLFGMQNYNGGKRLVITEGELDAMAVQSAWYKKYKTFYPVVSLRSASSVKDLIELRDWVRNFNEVILWMDKDDAGETALKEAARIIGYDKIKVVRTAEKDACDLWI